MGSCSECLGMGPLNGSLQYIYLDSYELVIYLRVKAQNVELGSDPVHCWHVSTSIAWSCCEFHTVWESSGTKRDKLDTTIHSSLQHVCLAGSLHSFYYYNPTAHVGWWRSCCTCIVCLSKLWKAVDTDAPILFFQVFSTRQSEKVLMSSYNPRLSNTLMHQHGWNMKHHQTTNAQKHPWEERCVVGEPQDQTRPGLTWRSLVHHIRIYLYHRGMTKTLSIWVPPPSKSKIAQRLAAQYRHVDLWEITVRRLNDDGHLQIHCLYLCGSGKIDWNLQSRK